jgi:sulfane dehydrogenase subunit SoxC
VSTEVDSAISPDELQLAARNHGLPLEALRDDITPIGLHYLLTHFDIPYVDETAWSLEIGGAVEHSLKLTLSDLKARPGRTVPVTLECAGNGRALYAPHVISQPWLQEAVGTAEWTGTSLGSVLAEAGPAPDATEVVFTGLDRGVQGEVEHLYERSLPLAEATRDEVMLVYAVNGRPLPPQHGFPLRVVVPGWYGMTHVKWLQSITVVSEPFEGWQQDVAYRLRSSEEERGEPVSRILPRALMVPPGFPDFLSRTRFVAEGPVTLTGRAWSGWGSIERVEVSVDGRETWGDAELGEPLGEFARREWRYEWQAERGEVELSCRATDATGRTQPSAADWNYDGLCNNGVQRVRVVVRGT